ncbi:hypothetical protein SAMN04244553_1089 [Nocardia amikacinitolerans]|uniref:Uncharacterized protein n=1 Tax=Nocardia amikacinitolerans TaxID=756689 RepID=A0A285L148_9NOCA|nr:hypothetical protein [Nocardia amikacinitolerans]SNY77777.1 hypothetical protein SAMN04244553_1089 [Nocardia amikacinitolerans]
MLRVREATATRTTPIVVGACESEDLPVAPDAPRPAVAASWIGRSTDSPGPRARWDGLDQVCVQ